MLNLPAISLWSFLTCCFKRSTLSFCARFSCRWFFINPELSFKSLAWLSFSWFWGISQMTRNYNLLSFKCEINILTWLSLKIMSFVSSSCKCGMFCCSCSSKVLPCPRQGLGALVWTPTDTVWGRGGSGGWGCCWPENRKPSWCSLSRVSNSSVSSSHTLQWLSRTPYICRKWFGSIWSRPASGAPGGDGWPWDVLCSCSGSWLVTAVL